MSMDDDLQQDRCLRSHVEGGATPLMKNLYLKSKTGQLKDALLGPTESFRRMGLGNAAWWS